MKKTIFSSLVLIFCMFVFVNNVSAEVKTQWDQLYVNGSTVKYQYDNSNSGYEATNKLGYPAGYFSLNIDGTNHIAYCVEFGINIHEGSAQGESLLDYFSDAIGATKAKELINKISLYAKFGYGSTSARKTDKYFFATQQLIWEAISDAGLYASDHYKTRANEGGVANWEPLKISNLRWVTVSNATTVTSTIDVGPEIAEIKQAVKDYYITPSFCNYKEELEIEVNETLTISDDNRVLSQYKVLCDDGIKCEINGNKLTISGVKETGNRQITFSKDHTGTENYIYRSNNMQGIILNTGVIEGISCDFGVNGYKNVQTSDTSILYVITIGAFCAVIAYIVYSSKKVLS